MNKISEIIKVRNNKRRAVAGKINENILRQGDKFRAIDRNLPISSRRTHLIADEKVEGDDEHDEDPVKLHCSSLPAKPRQTARKNTDLKSIFKILNNDYNMSQMQQNKENSFDYRYDVYIKQFKDANEKNCLKHDFLEEIIGQNFDLFQDRKLVKTKKLNNVEGSECTMKYPSIKRGVRKNSLEIHDTDELQMNIDKWNQSEMENEKSKDINKTINSNKISRSKTFNGTKASILKKGKSITPQPALVRKLDFVEMNKEPNGDNLRTYITQNLDNYEIGCGELDYADKDLKLNEQPNQVSILNPDSKYNTNSVMNSRSSKIDSKSPDYNLGNNDNLSTREGVSTVQLKADNQDIHRLFGDHLEAVDQLEKPSENIEVNSGDIDIDIDKAHASKDFDGNNSIINLDFVDESDKNANKKNSKHAKLADQHDNAHIFVGEKGKTKKRFSQKHPYGVQYYEENSSDQQKMKDILQHLFKNVDGDKVNPKFRIRPNTLQSEKDNYQYIVGRRRNGVKLYKLTNKDINGNIAFRSTNKVGSVSARKKHKFSKTHTSCSLNSNTKPKDILAPDYNWEDDRIVEYQKGKIRLPNLNPSPKFRPVRLGNYHSKNYRRDYSPNTKEQVQHELGMAELNRKMKALKYDDLSSLSNQKTNFEELQAIQSAIIYKSALDEYKPELAKKFNGINQGMTGSLNLTKFNAKLNEKLAKNTDNSIWLDHLSSSRLVDKKDLKKFGETGDIKKVPTGYGTINSTFLRTVAAQAKNETKIKDNIRDCDLYQVRKKYPYLGKITSKDDMSFKQMLKESKHLITVDNIMEHILKFHDEDEKKFQEEEARKKVRQQHEDALEERANGI